MADGTKVSAMAPVEVLKNAARFPVVQDGDNFSASVEDVLALVPAPEPLPSVYGPYRGARVAASAEQPYTILNVWETVKFDRIERDSGGFYDPAQPNRLYVPVGVTKVRLASSIVGAATDTFERNVFQFFKNGSGDLLGGVKAYAARQEGAHYSDIGTVFETDVLEVQAGDYFELRYTAESSFSLAANMTWFSLEVVERSGASATPFNAALDELLDVAATNPAEGDTLVWDGAQARWRAGRAVSVANEAAGLNKPFKGAMAVFTADRQVAGAAAPVMWDAAEYDTDAFWSAGNRGRFTIPAGIRKVRLHAVFYPSGSPWPAAGANVHLAITKNASIFYRGAGSLSIKTGYQNGPIAVSTAVLPVVPGDFFEVNLYNSFGAVSMSGVTCGFSIEVVEMVS